MHLSHLRRALTAGFLCLVAFISAGAQVSPGGAARLMPDRLGSFRAQGPILPPSDLFDSFAAEDYRIVSAARRTYLAPGGDAGAAVEVTLFKTDSNSSAYALLKSAQAAAHARVARVSEVKAINFATPESIAFFKGPTFVTVSARDKSASQAALLTFAQLFADSLEGTSDIPILVQHLPQWESVEDRTRAAASLPALQAAVGQRPVLEAVSFDGGTESVTAPYGTARLVIIEFTTPQYAADNDRQITQRLAQLREAGQESPVAYKRIGNYSVFVFDAPDDQTAQQLLGSVKYEKEVRWLGDNPRSLDQAQRQYGTTMGGVILGSLKVAGLSLVLSLGIGGLIGGAVFMIRRRSQALRGDIYSDAGGMLRLNIDDIHVEPERPRQLRGES